MPDYTLELAPAAKRDLKKLPRAVQHAIVFTHLPEIAHDPFGSSTPLVGALQQARAYHVGRKPEYRIVFYVEKSVITVTLIGARENLHKRVIRRKHKP